MLEYHDYSNIFPMIAENEFNEFKEDILKNGLRDAIWLYEDKILDGRNRYKACVESGVETRFNEYEGDDPLGFVVSLNLQRRHLDTSQRAMVAAKIATLPKGANQHVEISTPSQEEAANTLNVSRASVISARKVIENGTEELNNSVESGQVAVSAAAVISELPKDDQKEIVDKGKKEIINAANSIKKSNKKVISIDKKINEETNEKDNQIEQLTQENKELSCGILSIEEENAKLRDALATNQLPDIEIQTAAEIIEELREKVRILEIDLQGVKDSRDSYLQENEQLKYQCRSQSNQLKKLSNA